VGYHYRLSTSSTPSKQQHAEGIPNVARTRMHGEAGVIDVAAV
jgi:hypothetical protein